MPRIPSRFAVTRLFGRIALGVHLLATMTLVGCGIYALMRQDELWGFVLMAGGLSAAALGVLMYARFSLSHKNVSIAYRTYDTLLDIGERLRRQSDDTRTIADNSSLSEWAKRVIYREKDYEYLRDTIQSEFVRQDWAGAERLINEMDQEFGMHEEADELREQMRAARQATTEEKVALALQRFDQLCELQKWEQAKRESRRLKSLFPSDPRIADLPQEIEQRRQQHKRRLLKEYDVAVRTQNVDRAHEILLELDHYLAPNEAAALKESARGVFRAKLLQMGVEFSLAVSEKRFPDAVSIGERIVKEFPNSRYAHEIRGMLPALQQRVHQEAAVSEP